MPDVHKILLFMKRKPGMSVADFRAYYEQHHAPLALRHGAAMTRYVRRFLDPQPHAESGTCAELPYDVITELWFDDEAKFRGTLAYISTQSAAGSPSIRGVRWNSLFIFSAIFCAIEATWRVERPLAMTM